MNSARDLMKGSVYFLFDYHHGDRGELYPRVGAYVYLGRDLPGNEPGHVFQTTASYSEDGSWTELSAVDRLRVGNFDRFALPEDKQGNIGYISDVNEVVEKLTAFSLRVNQSQTPDQPGSDVPDRPGIAEPSRGPADAG